MGEAVTGDAVGPNVGRPVSAFVGKLVAPAGALDGAAGASVGRVGVGFGSAVLGLSVGATVGIENSSM